MSAPASLFRDPRLTLALAGKGHRFDYATVREHMKRCHPGCPTRVRKAICNRVVTRAWASASLGRAVGVCMEMYVRHELTDYDARLAAGEDRAAVRKAIRAEMNAIVRGWAQSPL